MIIALFLFALAMSVALPALTNLVDLGNRGAANGRASADASYALQVVEADLRRAQGIRGAGEFVGNGGSAPTVTAALSSRNASGHDIVAAGPTRLVLHSDVLATSPGPERVAYALVQQTRRSAAGPCDHQARTSWCIVRTVSPSAGAETTEVIAHGAGTFPRDSSCIPGTPPSSATPRLFCYQHKVPDVPGTLATRYRWAGWSPRCRASWGAPPAPAPDWNSVDIGAGPAIRTYHDRTGLLPQSSVWPLDTISAIGIVLPAGGRTGGARGQVTRVTTVDLRNRASEEYLSAILCGGR